MSTKNPGLNNQFVNHCAMKKKKTANLAHNKNNCANVCPKMTIVLQYSIEIPISSHGILKTHICKDQDLIKSVIFTASPRTFLGETSILFYHECVAIKEYDDFPCNWSHCLDFRNSVSIHCCFCSVITSDTVKGEISFWIILK